MGISHTYIPSAVSFTRKYVFCGEAEIILNYISNGTLLLIRKTLEIQSNLLEMEQRESKETRKENSKKKNRSA